MQDRSTIISIFPLAIGPEEKPGIYPGSFWIPPAAPGKISGIIVSESISYLQQDKNYIAISHSSYKIAKGIVEDYINSSLSHIYMEAEPGLFYSIGDYGIWDKDQFIILDADRIRKEFSSELKDAEKRQLNYFERLVKNADDDWQRNRQHKTITNLHRAAATALGLDRDWNKAYAEEALSKCPVCLSLVNPDAIICMNCKTILKPEEAKKYQFAGEK